MPAFTRNMHMRLPDLASSPTNARTHVCHICGNEVVRELEVVAADEALPYGYTGLIRSHSRTRFLLIPLIFCLRSRRRS